MREYSDTKLIIIDTLQKVRESGGEAYSYANDYEVITKLKRFTDKSGVCLLLVHHTRKQQSDDKFDMISGTNGLMGCADGAFVLHKECRTSNTAILDVVGRDQQDQRIYLVRNEERLTWEFERVGCKPWKEPPDPLLEAVAKLVTPDSPTWRGTATEMAGALDMEIQPNILTRRLNVKAGKLFSDYQIEYAVKRTRIGSSISMKRQADTV